VVYLCEEDLACAGFGTLLMHVTYGQTDGHPLSVTHYDDSCHVLHGACLGIPQYFSRLNVNIHHHQDQCDSNITEALRGESIKPLLPAPNNSLKGYTSRDKPPLATKPKTCSFLS
jgi:hypothetical protein